MSTIDRYSDAVWDGFCKSSFLVDDNIYNYASVGEIAERAGVSKPTVKKYMDAFAQSENVAALKIGKQTFYRMRVVNGEIA